MTDSALVSDREAFAQRLRTQIAARYRAASVEVDPAAFGIRVRDGGGATLLALAPLHQAVVRDPASAPRLISNFVASVEKQLGATAPLELSTARLLWCVRAGGDIEKLARSGDLLTHDVGGGLVAFVAESLPASIMRGVPRQEWEAQAVRDDDVRRIANENTGARFAPLVERIRRADRVPRDGWRIASDPMFQGSVLMVPAALRALCDLARGDVLLAVPDRGLVLAIAARLSGADRFARRVLREWREAMNPCSRELLITDGAQLRAVPRRSRRVPTLVMPWLQE